jgi:phytoene dehydrogenase-like protein
MYDVIVIGRDLSSLIAALASARYGLKTILVNEGKFEMEHREAGYGFPIDPTPFSGIGENQTVGCLIKELRLTPDAIPPPRVLDPALQVIFNDHRVDLFHDRERLIIDMVREFPQQERVIRRFYHALSQAENLIERWIGEDHNGQSNVLRKFFRGLLRLPTAVAGRFSLLIRGNQNDSAFRKVIEAQLAVLSHLDCSHCPFPLSAAYLLALPQRAAYDAYDKISWMSWLCEEFTDAGGILMEDCSVIRIDTNPEVIVDVESAGSSQTLRGKKLVVSVQWEKLKLLLFHEKIFRRLVRKLDALQPTLYPFSLHLGVYAEGLPEALAPCAVVVSKETKTTTDQSLVFIALSRPDETEHAPKGRRAITATVFLKESPLILADLELKGIAKSIIDTLEGFLPFLRESIDFVNIEKSIELSRHSQEIVCQKYPLQKRTIIGINTLSPETPLHDVFLTGGILRAGLGFEGEILAGLDAAFMAGKEIQSHER